MLYDKLRGWKLILASKSPRRHDIFRQLKLDFEVRLKPVEETFPEHLKGTEVSDYLAQLKALPFKDELNAHELLITSDTVVWHKGKILGKPLDKKDAITMLTSMSGDWHEVITSICLTTNMTQHTAHGVTKVKFKKLIAEEIAFYIDNFRPYDKAGAYGIQEWIGHIGIEEIQGSYTNVMGLPTHVLYRMLSGMVS